MASDKLTSELDALVPTNNYHGLKIDALWGDQPEVLDSIKAARLRRCTYVQIAKALSTEGATVSPDAVKRWLETNGIE